MTPGEARDKCILFSALKQEGASDDEIWEAVFDGLTNDEILEVHQSGIDMIREEIQEALAEGVSPRMLWAIFTEHIVL